ncbi:DNA-binding protein [uncultured Roseibium sp.]|uniref:helix-turn-helix domain-containing protein n=1 Tax=uncultured Roseibium sp. TaxID=1936171 RepID=UPI00262A22DC|nr:DNA-binding protein [uncultured Roseibium sp.]
MKAFTIRALKEAGILGPTKAYEEINAGRLIARKVGKKTVILEQDLKAWLDALPRM